MSDPNFKYFVPQLKLYIYQIQVPQVNNIKFSFKILVFMSFYV